MLSEIKSDAIQYKTLDDAIIKEFLSKADVEGLISLPRQSLNSIILEGDYPTIRKLDIAFNEFKVRHDVGISLEIFSIRILFIHTFSPTPIALNHIQSLRGIDHFPRLRQLNVYCNRLTDASDVQNCTALTHLLIQQNGISSIPLAFQTLKHLRELRLDGNGLGSISNLQNCTALRVLDVSFNDLESLAGVSGLQSLKELRANNNRILSLKPLKALPSLIELQVSNNLLTSLDGVQQLQCIETVYADHNRITTIRIPQTYCKQAPPREDNSSSSSGYSKSGGALSHRSTGTGRMSTNPSARTVGSSRTDGGGQEAVVVLGMNTLTDVHLSHNSIASLDGLDSLGANIEILDLDSNRMDLCGNVQPLVAALASLQRLVDIKLRNNLEQGEIPDELAEALLSACPRLRGLATASSSSGSNTGVSDDKEASTSGRNTGDGGGSDSDDDDDQARAQAAAQGTSQLQRLVADLKEPVANEDIMKMEGSFKQLLGNCKDGLLTLVRIAGGPADDDDDRVDEPRTETVVRSNAKVKSRSLFVPPDSSSGDSRPTLRGMPRPSHAQDEEPRSTTFLSDLGGGGSSLGGEGGSPQSVRRRVNLTAAAMPAMLKTASSGQLRCVCRRLSSLQLFTAG